MLISQMKNQMKLFTKNLRIESSDYKYASREIEKTKNSDLI